MGYGNKALRNYAIPFISNYVELGSIEYGSIVLSSPQAIISSSRTAAVPMTQPEKGDIVEAYLYMEMTAPSDKALEVYIGVGDFTTENGDLIVTPETEYSEAYILAQHRAVIGSDDPFTVAANGTLTIDADITRLIPKRGDPRYLSDAFCLIVSFGSLPDQANGYSLEKFKLSCTAQIGLGT